MGEKNGRFGNRTANRIVLGVVAVALVAIMVFVLTTGRAQNPVIFVLGALAVVAIGIWVYLKRAR